MRHYIANPWEIQILWKVASILVSDFEKCISFIGEGNGNSLQYSYLENPRDGGGWWAAIYGVAQSRT